MPWTRPQLIGTDETASADFLTKRILTYREAILEGLDLLLKSDPDTYILGEGVDDASGIFGTTKGLIERYGTDRVVDIPLAENGMTGIAIGTALTGMKPIFVHMRPDFMILALDQLLNHAAKWSYMSNGEVPVPLTLRAVSGRGWGSAAQHSQNIQGLLTYMPGIKVVMPATAYDAKGLLIAAVREPNPVVILEHRWLYDKKGYVPEGLYETPIGNAYRCREGNDLTIVAVSTMVHEAMAASEKLEQMGISPEVIDLRSIKPWDRDMVCTSVRKTGKLLIADTGHAYGGCAAEIAAVVAENCWNELERPVRRIALPEAPTPASSILEQLYYPDWKNIVAAAQDLTQYKLNTISLSIKN